MLFPVSIHSHLTGDITIQKNQYTVVYTPDTQLINDFLMWINGEKLILEDTVSFVNDGEICSSLYELKKHQKVLRFQLKSKLVGDYSQQRYHATENDDLLTLDQFMGEINDSFLKEMMVSFGLTRLMDEKLNMLSTGEFKKALTIKAADEKSDLLFVEEPGIGVDKESRKHLNQLFQHLADNGTSVVVLTSTKKWPVNDQQIIEINRSIKEDDSSVTVADIKVPGLKKHLDCECVFELQDVVVRYQNRNVLDKVNWKIKPNEKWALTGKNGAGKSTLLSIINADNPQSYSNEVYSFGRKRGAGKSIWEIKEQIGYYSSELHRYLNKRQKVEEVIRSLVIQNPYKKRPLNKEEYQFRDQILKYFGLYNGLEQMFYELSPARQKLVVLCGVLVKNAPLLILDEPFQGFNDDLVTKAKNLIELYAANRTFIMVTHNEEDFPALITKRFHLTNGDGREMKMNS
ncbi:ATP-binding cassette domain-containing protein [Carboxylicivirga caseinilyticus]|uniref:ATP-binding cassette domain-containing protein n=1 Tax=Carboxylicivirga caseinilyticus TaxID=3417572 RepID=UPI003D34C942|nr:ATP-binding cassette domain-containing protein [Marinilabiliaceae bacterium A049]